MHKTFGKCTQTTDWNYELVSLTLNPTYIKYVSIWALASAVGWLRHWLYVWLCYKRVLSLP